MLSDVHGFSLALDRVLDDIAGHSDIDEIVVAGDLAEGGPDPLGALTRLRESGATLLQGNTDRDLGETNRSSKHFAFAESLLGSENLEFLRMLPSSHRISPPGGKGPDDDLLIVHANPFDLDRAIRPDANESDLEDLIGNTRAAVLAFGHIHIAYVRELDRMTLFDVSAVGNPKDGDPRSKWGLATWEETGRTWSVEHQFVDYPLEETIAQFHAVGYPKADAAVAKLTLASYGA